MILTYNEFEKILNERLFEGSRKDLLEKLANNPDRYVGLFRPSDPYTKIIQNITHSHEIRFGDALEDLGKTYLSKCGYTFLKNSLPYVDGEKAETTLNIDLFFFVGDILFMVEQKVRDDHDSTKKRGQFQNFKKKYEEVKKIYGKDFTIHPVMWFVDPSLKKNKSYYIAEMKNMDEMLGCTSRISYGGEFFELLDELTEKTDHIKIWNEWNAYLRTWKKELPDLPRVNFDEDVDEVLKELETVSILDYKKIFSNEELKNEILPIISQDNVFIKLLLDRLRDEKETTTKVKLKGNYEEVILKIENYLNLVK